MRIVTEKSMLTSKLNVELTKKLVRFYVWSITQYDSGTLNIKKIEMQLFGELRNVVLGGNGDDKMVENVTHKRVLKRIGKKMTHLSNILRRNANLIGHILRRNCLFHDAMEGQVMELKSVGRRKRLLDNLRNIRYWKLQRK